MAHWAELDDNNVVLRVTVGDNNDPAGDEGYQWLIDNLGGRWIKTSYNANIRGKFAGIGDIYDEEADRFYSSSPFLSWTLNRTSWTWEAPTPMPNDGQKYRWVEDDLNWQVVEETPAE